MGTILASEIGGGLIIGRALFWGGDGRARGLIIGILRHIFSCLIEEHFCAPSPKINNM